MAHYFDSDGMTSMEMLIKVSQITLGLRQRAMFLTGPGMGTVVCQRIRVRLSKKRAEWRSGGKKLVEYTLHQEVFQIRDRVTGKRSDVVVMWARPRHLAEELEILAAIMKGNESHEPQSVAG